MKKFILLVTFLLVTAFGTSCLAAGAGSALVKEEKAADLIITAINADNTKAFPKVSKALAPELKEKLHMNVFIALQKQVQEKFGTLKEYRLLAFERHDQSDKLAYVVAYENDVTAEAVFLFDATHKVTEFTFTPLSV